MSALRRSGMGGMRELGRGKWDYFVSGIEGADGTWMRGVGRKWVNGGVRRLDQDGCLAMLGHDERAPGASDPILPAAQQQRG